MKRDESGLHLMSARSVGRLEVLNLLLVHLDLDLLLIGQVAHVVRIVVDNEPVVWGHMSRKRDLQRRGICFLQLVSPRLLGILAVFEYLLWRHVLMSAILAVARAWVGLKAGGVVVHVAAVVVRALFGQVLRCRGTLLSLAALLPSLVIA